MHVAGWGGDGYAEAVRGLNVEFHDIPVSLSPVDVLQDLRLIRSLQRLYRSVNPDIVHQFTIKPVIYGSLAARTMGIRNVVNTITGLGYAFTDAPWLLSRVIRVMYRLALTRSAVVFFQNPDDRRLFENLRIVDKSKAKTVAGSGVDIEYFHPRFRHRRENKTVNVFFVGRLLKDKGVLEYFAVARALRRNDDRFRFFAVGDFDKRNPSCITTGTFEEATAAGDVKWLGKTDDIRSYLATADIVCLPSYREGVPRSLLEAAAMGIAIVATDVPGCRSVVRHGYNGLLVPPRDEAALAAAIEQIGGDVKRRDRMGRAGREKIVAEFDEEIVFQETWRTYQQLLTS